MVGCVRYVNQTGFSKMVFLRKVVVRGSALAYFVIIAFWALEGFCNNDLRRECPYWSRQGYCISSRQYMMMYCKKSCSAYSSRRVAAAPSGCGDSDYRCPMWRSFCNQQHIRNRCRRTCGLCRVMSKPNKPPSQSAASPKACGDRDYRCLGWLPYCSQANIKAICRKTCGLCKVARKPATPQTSCIDSKWQCGAWAGKGECHRNPAYMLKNCQKSCACCKDAHRYCSQWLKRPGCSNRGVQLNCKKSCRTCGKIIGQKKTKTKQRPQPRTNPITTATKKTKTTTIKAVVTTVKPYSVTSPFPFSDPICGTKFTLQLMVGGRRANVAEWPWVVGIAPANNESRVFCGGSIISNEWILSAAHCWMMYPSYKAKDYVVRVSDLSLKEFDKGEQVIAVKEIRNHPSFNPLTYDNDISIVRLAKPIKYTVVARPLCLPENEQDGFSDGKSCLAAGWGLLEEDGLQADYLQVATLPLVNHQKCRDQYQQVKNDVTKNMICAGAADGKVDACSGDSGSPLFCRSNVGTYKQVGIVSWGRGCARKGFPGVYTKVSNYRQWIIDTIAKMKEAST